MENKFWPLESPGITEAIINNQVVIYHACSSRPLHEAKAFYSSWEYIGSGYIHSVNGVVQSFPKGNSYHFFIKPSK